MALELTIGLVALAGVLFFLLRSRRKTSVDKAAEAARKAVQGRVGRGERDERDKRS